MYLPTLKKQVLRLEFQNLKLGSGVFPFTGPKKVFESPCLQWVICKTKKAYGHEQWSLFYKNYHNSFRLNDVVKLIHNCNCNSKILQFFESRLTDLL